MKTLWSDQNDFETVNELATRHLSNAIYNLYEDIAVLKEELAEAREEIISLNERCQDI